MNAQRMRIQMSYCYLLGSCWVAKHDQGMDIRGPAGGGVVPPQALAAEEAPLLQRTVKEGDSGSVHRHTMALQNTSNPCRLPRSWDHLRLHAVATHTAHVREVDLGCL
jgi:hypothetical protein